MKNRQTKTTHRYLMIVLAVSHLLAASAQANDATRVDSSRSKPKETRSSARKPQIGRGMDPDDSFALKFAFKGAIKRLEKDESCRALFDDLILDGLQAMGSSRYRPAQSPGERARCARGVAGGLVPHLQPGKPPQLVVDQRHQRLQRLSVTFTPLEQEPRDRSRCVVCNPHLDSRRTTYLSPPCLAKKSSTTDEGDPVRFPSTPVEEDHEHTPLKNHPPHDVDHDGCRPPSGCRGSRERSVPRR